MPKTTARRRAHTRRILNCLPSPSPETDWGFGAAVLAGVANTSLPTAKDLRADWWPVGDQGRTGSCVGWAVADGLLRWHFVKAGWIPQAERLSVRFSWMAAKEADELTSRPTTFIEPEGTTLKAALDVARKFGSVIEADLPFAGATLYAEEAEVFYAKAAQLRIASYHNLEPSLTSWRRWLANNGPILVRLLVDKTWADASVQPLLSAFRPETARGGHAALLVGYAPGRFIVRNSWGTDWGDGGYAYASDAYAAAAFTESYGVSVGQSLVAPGIALQAATPKAAAKPIAATGAWTIEEIEALVVQKARQVSGRPVSLGLTVGNFFADLSAVDALLGAIQKALKIGGQLTMAPDGEKRALCKVSFFALADWVFRKLQGAGGDQ